MTTIISDARQLPYLGLGCMVEAEGRSEGRANPVGWFQVRAIWVPPDCAHSFQLLDLRVGSRSLTNNMQPLPLGLFARRRGVALEVPPIGPAGPDITIAVENPHRTARMFRAVLIGEPIAEPPTSTRTECENPGGMLCMCRGCQHWRRQQHAPRSGV